MPALPLRDALVVALTKLGVSALVLASGFRAVSDDDFARVVIAQRFAASPALDPTGTSWLPLPFWLQGGVMAIFGPGLEIARASAVLAGVASALLVWMAAHFAGVPRRPALVGALIAAAVPYAAWLGVATVPDYPAAALALVGVASANSEHRARRLLGALALSAATLCRYEAWSLAAGFAALALWDAVRRRKAALVWPALIALSGPASWLAHGAFHHGDALFFVERVSAYKRAVGGAQPLGMALIGQPLAVLRCEPELAAATLVIVASAIATRHTQALRRHRRALGLLALLLAFLVAGEIRASGATHHAERAVLAIWLWLAIFAADVAFDAWRDLAPRMRATMMGATIAAVVLGATILRPWYARRDSFIDRSAEIAVGRELAHLASDDDRVVVDTPDFGFFAVIAGFGHAARARPLDDRDPRKGSRPEPYASPSALREALGGARFLVLPAARLDAARGVGSVRASSHGYTVIEIHD